jgi:hypothetical protein
MFSSRAVSCAQALASDTTALVASSGRGFLRRPRCSVSVHLDADRRDARTKVGGFLRDPREVLKGLPSQAKHMIGSRLGQRPCLSTEAQQETREAMVHSRQLEVSELERRLVPSASVALVVGVLTVRADDQGDSFLVRPTGAAVEVDVLSESGLAYRFDPATVSSIFFQGGGGKRGDSFLNLTAIASELHAGANAGVNCLQGGSGDDALFGDPNARGDSYLTDFAGVNLMVGGAGLNNFFGLGGNETITTGTGENRICDILGTNTIDARQGHGYVIRNQGSVATSTIGPDYDVVTFFQGFTSPAVLQPDQNGHGILYLNPVAGQSGVSFALEPVGSSLLVTYIDATGWHFFAFPKGSVDWIASFGTPGDDTYVDDSAANDVLFGSGGDDALFSGMGRFSILNGQSGNDYMLARARYNDVTAGTGADFIAPAGPPSGMIVYRVNQAAVTTQVWLYNGRRDVLIGVPLSVNGVVDPNDRDGVPDVEDYVFWFLFARNALTGPP